LPTTDPRNSTSNGFFRFSEAGFQREIAVLIVALLAFALKLIIAFHTLGTNDVVIFYGFARQLTDHGLEWVYLHSIWFNHPPLSAYFLEGIYHLDHQPFFRENGFLFPFLLRAPGIISDLIAVLLLIRIQRTVPQFRMPLWALLAFAISPISLMVSGFHGNTDSVMVMFLLCAAYMCLRDRPMLSGLFFALSCQIKIVPLLFLPAFFFFWSTQRKMCRFVIPVALVSLSLWSQPLLHFPIVFLKNVFSYGGFYGLWGITYCLRMTGLPQLSKVGFYDLPAAETTIAVLLKIIIIMTTLVMAWRCRRLGPGGLIRTLACTWIVFFVFSPAICGQYLVWLAPFILLLSPVLYAHLLLSGTVFLFFFYNVMAHGFPWYYARSTTELFKLWDPWALWPWLTLVFAIPLLWNHARQQYTGIRFLSLEPVVVLSNNTACSIDGSQVPGESVD